MSAGGRGGRFPSSRGRGGERAWRPGRGGGRGGRGTIVKGRATGSGADLSSATKPAALRGDANLANKETRKTPSQEVLARAAAIREKASQYVNDGSSSGSEEEEEEREGSDLVLRNMLKVYYQDLGTDGADEIDEQLLQASMIAASGSCLVCLSSIRRTEAVWSCLQCYCLFHLQCIQQWARDGVHHSSLLTPELFPGQESLWTCPKCRHDYPSSKLPQTYHCYCFKQVNPAVDPWLLPHSCGDICDKPLKPECGHRCVSLCHPGPCPPCPKTTTLSCYCGRSVPVVRRCGVGGWVCGRVCRRELTCGIHLCEKQCHEGVCGNCEEVEEQLCQCGREREQLPCSSPPWQCSQVCRKLLSCSHHKCDRVCHSGPCGACPRSGTRTCPCGRTKHNLPCNEDVPTCRDTCNKSLPCGVHQCTRPCHYGDCGQCLQVAVKRCRCGKREKEVPCSSLFLCELKCPLLRQCGRHQCKRKCCDGHCPACEQVCGRSLGCRNHKCASPCHRGQCYPCVLTVKVTCACTITTATVPCGRERQTKPPKCREICKKQPSCHHPKRLPHYCHHGPCPPCTQPCAKPLGCSHVCLSPCHSLPQLPKVRPPGVAPWVKLEPVVIECPRCTTPLLMACKGGHEVSEQPCSSLHSYSCGRECGRMLPCANHTCGRGCHEVVNAHSETRSGEDCLECTRGCEKPRPPGCGHICPRHCHPGDCGKCEVLVKLLCHCKTMNLYVKCFELTAANEAKKVELQTCNSQCTQQLTCGHRCPRQCHPGSCPSSQSCRRKVTLRCPCRRLKKEVKCFERESKVPFCDEECKRLIMEREEERRREEERKREEEKRERREEEAAILRQMQPKRRRRRQKKVDEEEEAPTNYQQYRLPLLLGCAVVGVVILCLLGYKLLTINNV